MIHAKTTDLPWKMIRVDYYGRKRNMKKLNAMIKGIASVAYVYIPMAIKLFPFSA